MAQRLVTEADGQERLLRLEQVVHSGSEGRDLGVPVVTGVARSGPDDDQVDALQGLRVAGQHVLHGLDAQGAGKFRVTGKAAFADAAARLDPALVNPHARLELVVMHSSFRHVHAHGGDADVFHPITLAFPE